MLKKPIKPTAAAPKSLGKLFASPSPTSFRARANCAKRLILERTMKQQRHFDTLKAAQLEAVKIRNLIGSLDRSIRLISCDIIIEEERTGISNRSDTTYSILARMMAARRDNLKDTITALEKRLSTLDQAELVAEPA
jgi:hypothetical protein